MGHWQDMPGGANDIGIGANGAVWVIGTNSDGANDYGIFEWDGNKWNAMPGAASKIAVDPGGNAWCVSANGSIHKWAGSNWQDMPGGAKDIGIGANGAVWVIGTNSDGASDYGIFKWDGSKWQAMPGAASKIAVDPSGNAWCVSANGSIHKWAGSNWQDIPGGANDIGIGANGAVWVIGTNSDGANDYGIFEWDGNKWQTMPGAASKLSVDPGGNAWCVSANGSIHKWVVDENNISTKNFTVSPDGHTITYADNITSPNNGGSIAIGGNFKIVLSSNGDYSFSGHMHDSGFVGYKYSVAIAIAIASGITYTFSQSNSVEGTVNALPFGSPNRDSNWNESKNNVSLKEKWNDIVNSGQFVWKATTHDTLTSGISDLVQAAAADALKSLISKGIQSAVQAIVALV